MRQTFAIDTSILVRLVSGLPVDLFDQTLAALQARRQAQNQRFVASNMVIGEAYIALQHHFGVSKADARRGLADALSSGLIEPLGGDATLDAIDAAAKGCGLMDRLIALDAAEHGAHMLTLDRKMAKLPNAQLLENVAATR